MILVQKDIIRSKEDWQSWQISERGPSRLEEERRLRGIRREESRILQPNNQGYLGQPQN